MSTPFLIPAHIQHRVQQLLMRAQPRCLLGLVGAPGAGKSTLASALQTWLGTNAQVVPMDGFHLANAELQRLGLSDRKGAPETFDSAGYVALLQRLRHPHGTTVYAPEFRREWEEPVAGSIGIHPDTQLLITEGNYLLLPEGHWAQVRPLLDEVWYLDPTPALRLQRLHARHMHFGRSAAEAQAWIATTDEPNARRIEDTRSSADWQLPLE